MICIGVNSIIPIGMIGFGTSLIGFSLMLLSARKID